MKLLLQHFILAGLLFGFLAMPAQKVGVVLSGGGASGLAHIGFLKSLESQNVPIDYITGTSMGAVIGALYASGYPIEVIDSLARTDEFANMVLGNLIDEQQYFYREPELDASMARIKISKQGLEKSLPTNLIDPVILDFKLLELFSQASAAANYDFDQLYIPFRCVASDIESKKEVVFRAGHLNLATRASATYPFYLEPLTVNGKLLFDGGLYNNFPGNVMYQDFMPDVIIGCNVSTATEAPQADDIISQVRTMILARSSYDSLCTEMIVVQPDIQVGTFDFNAVEQAVFSGYLATEEKMMLIKQEVAREESIEERSEKRKVFRSKFKPLVFGEVSQSGLDKKGENYLRNFTSKRDSVFDVPYIRRRFFQLFADENIRSIFPLATYNPMTGLYDLHLKIRRERDITARFGGNFSSRSINTGYVGLTYNFFGRNSTQINADSYFGKFYGSIKLAVKRDFQTRIPFTGEIRGQLHRWDYFTNFATFFEPVKPSFIVQNEQYAGLLARFPLANKSRLQISTDYFLLQDAYYQTTAFSIADTTDFTRLKGLTSAIKYERSTLNRKQYANAGTYLSLSARWVRGQETTIPGSTQPFRDTTEVLREWVLLKASYTNYFKKWKALHLGFRLDAAYSTLPLLTNFRATLMRAPAFEPIAESSTFFLDQFRNTAYTAGGIVFIGRVSKNIEIRPEVYIFITPNGEIGANQLFEPELDFTIDPLFMGSASAIYHSPLGPVSLSVNYYDQKQEPWSVIFNFGYLINHARVLD